MNALDLAYALGAVVLSPVWARKARGGWRERFGHTPPLPPAAPGRPRLLIHAVSVGEVNTLRALVPMLAARGVEVVVAATTDTGLARARELFEASAATPAARVVRYPLDFSRSVRRFLDAVRPDAVALVELEVWPNFLRACGARHIPAAVINGRLSERSFRGYRRIRPIIGPSFASLAFAAVQDEAIAQRFAFMGVPRDRLHITGSMKWDSVPTDDPALHDRARVLARELGVDPARPLIVAGSTAEDEEALLHAACPPGVQLLCAPRKPEHYADAAAALPGCRRRSAGPVPADFPKTDRFLLDTLGELRAAYALADLVILGRSFGTLYGSDPMEPAALGKPLLIGPRHRDFESPVRALELAGALRVVAREDLPGTCAALLADAPARARMAHAATACVAANRGATARHAEMLARLLATLSHH
jgi:3-deoxy-D-manno-octulosonic-acid transferase